MFSAIGPIIFESIAQNTDAHGIQISRIELFSISITNLPVRKGQVVLLSAVKPAAEPLVGLLVLVTR